MAGPTSLKGVLLLLKQISITPIRTSSVSAGQPVKQSAAFSTLLRASNTTTSKATTTTIRQGAESPHLPNRTSTLAAVSGSLLSKVVQPYGGRSAHNDTGKVYDALAEVNAIGLKKLVPNDAKNEDFVRQHWSENLESQLNDMINFSYSISYTLHALSSFCGRDYISLRGLARWYIDRSNKERANALELSRYQSLRGGTMVLCPLAHPPTDFDDPEKGDALNTMELTLAMYKVQKEKFGDLARAADDEGDKEFADYITENFLIPMTILNKKTASYTSQLRRVGKGHGTWHFDHYLHKKLEAAHIGDEVRTGLGEIED